MLSFRVIIPMLSSRVIIPYYHLVLSLHIIISCYHPCYHLVLSPMLSSRVIISFYLPMLSSRVIILCYHLVLSSCYHLR
jgi:hypothetical protein